MFLKGAKRLSFRLLTFATECSVPVLWVQQVGEAAQRLTAGDTGLPECWQMAWW